MNDLAISTIRTVVPSIVGPFILLLARNGVELDAVAVAGITSFLIGLATGVYYLGVRVLAKKYPWVESLLGVAKKPEYKDVRA